jgi:hypothetical protein
MTPWLVSEQMPRKFFNALYFSRNVRASWSWNGRIK